MKKAMLINQAEFKNKGIFKFLNKLSAISITHSNLMQIFSLDGRILTLKLIEEMSQNTKSDSCTLFTCLSVLQLKTQNY